MLRTDDRGWMLVSGGDWNSEMRKTRETIYHRHVRTLVEHYSGLMRSFMNTPFEFIRIVASRNKNWFACNLWMNHVWIIHRDFVKISTRTSLFVICEYWILKGNKKYVHLRYRGFIKANPGKFQWWSDFDVELITSWLRTERFIDFNTRLNSL